ncbi:hypothetical protein FVR03_06705 [Pontibacter qinzhouensis]|uniref:Uncharacterized protein n=1 Tax=Pontibacter qinzhouensis TaxID=2603253 RepID=A0A5C8KDF1_9BACT|nr:PLP-dependent transferase [Pontibacter qinzhouensis]TXK49250.1 hypothetical protein FVR03_06705 [Pontibacter qinzhouensis]
MQTLHIHFDSRNYLYQKALATQNISQTTTANAFSLPALDKPFSWNATGKPIFFSDRLSQARFKLFRALLKKGQNVLSLNSDSQKWQELAHYKRHGYSIRQNKTPGNLAYKELVDEQTGILYLATIGDDLSVPDFQKVIRFAQDRGIKVIVDNTAGAEGILFDPIVWGADYVLSNLLHWHPDIKTQGHVVVRTSSLIIGDGWGDQSPYKKQKAGESRVIPLPTASFWRENPNEVARIKNKLAVTLQLAKWFQLAALTTAVVYPGLPTHPDHFNTLKFFRNGYGNQFFWSLEGQHHTYDKLQQQFIGVPVPGVKITAVPGKAVFKIEVRDGNLKEITDALQRAFALVSNAIGNKQRQDQEAQKLSDQIRLSFENDTIKKITASDF